jgi:hypothetical protein
MAPSSGPVRAVVEERERRDEEQVAGERRREVEDAVVCSRRVPDEHVGEHLFDDIGRRGVRDEGGPELARSDRTEGHVVTHDLTLVAVGVDDRVQCDV